MFNLTYSELQSQLCDSYRQLLARELTEEVATEAEASNHSQSLWQKIIDVGLFDMVLGDEDDRVCLLDLALLAEVVGEFLAPVAFCEPIAAIRLLERLGSGKAKTMLERVREGQLPATLTPRGAVRGRLLLVPAGAVAHVVLFRDGDQIVAETGTPPNDATPNLGSLPVSDRSTGAVEILAEGPFAVGAFQQAVLEWQVLVTAMVVGAGRRALKIGVDYTSNRRAFGVPVASFQSVSHRLADAATAMDGAQMLTWKAAWSLDEQPERWPTLAEMAFAFSAQASTRVVDEVLHFHGGYGMMLEYDIQKYFRSVKSWTLLVGDRVQHSRRATTSYL